MCLISEEIKESQEELGLNKLTRDMKLVSQILSCFVLLLGDFTT